MRRALLGLLFLCSGAAALCYEVAWTRHLVLVFGNTTRAVALLLGAYMLGLALGSEVGGRLADRTKRPAALYGIFEVAIAGFALAFPWLVDAVRAAYLSIGTSAPPVLFALAFLLLVVPTFLMGTTLPLLARATVSDASRTGRDVGFLYAMNVVGAVAGAAGTGFVLMESAGVLGATRVAAAVNAAVGIAGWLAFRGTPSAAQDADAAPPSGVAETPAARAALASAFVSGCVGLAAQVVWTRLLTFFLQGFTWTFSAILATFLAGLALGGAVFGRMASSSRDPARLLVRLHLAVAVAAAAALWALGDHYDVTRSMWRAAGSLAQDMGVRHRWTLVLSSAVVLLVPAFLMGGCFPVATALFQRGLGDLGARVGRLYAVNTVGCVVGSLVAGFVLQPWLGPSMSAAVVVGASLAGAAVVAVASKSGAGRVAGPVAAVACAGFLWAAEPSKPFLLRSHVFAGDRANEVVLEDERHGEVCTVSVVRNVRERFTLLYTDEFEAAGTKPEYRYMRMLAHLPVALAADPSHALVICFGTGTTSGSVSAHSAVRTLDIVEISPEVLATADRFADVNHGVLRGAGRDDLDVRVHVDDGRHFVLRSRETWGVISLEPLMPYTPAAIHFYTRDFYEICRERLAPGGVVCQWIPLQGMSGDDFRRLVAAFVAVYPESAMFFVDGAVALVGGPDGVSLSWSRTASRLADPRVAADLRSVGFDDPARALATFVSGGAKLREFAAGAEPCTDERPVLEFHPIPPGVALPWLGQNLEHMRRLRSDWEKLPVSFDGAGADAERASAELYLSLRSGNHVLDGLVALESSVLLTRNGQKQDGLAALRAARESFALAVSLDPGSDTARRSWEGLEREWWMLLGGVALDDGDAAGAERQFARALEFRAQRQDDVAWTRLAEARNRAGRADAALEAACEAVRRFPGGSEALAERAFARSALGDVAGASDDYRRAVRGDAAMTTLPARLRPDAERARNASPWTDAAAAPSAESVATEARALVADPKAHPLGARLRLRVLSSDHPDAIRAAFAKELAGPASGGDDAAAAASIAALRLAAPPGAADAFEAWLAAGRPAVADAAAEGLVETDAGRAVAWMQSGRREGLAAVAAAAGRGRDRRLVRPLLALLRDESSLVRTAAHRSLFALTRGDAPGIATLDTSDPRSAAYRRAVLDIESWWAREADRQPGPK